MTSDLFITLAMEGVAPGDVPSRLWGWEAADFPMFIFLPVLLVLSGFFSGSETALFGLTESQRMTLRKGGTRAGRAVEALLSDQRMLLITILLGNTTVNVLYFVTGSVLMMRSTYGPLGEAAAAGCFLLLMILAGEIGPKIVANTRRAHFAAATATPLLALHRIITPIRIILGDGVIAPLGRLAAPSTPPGQLDDDELKALLETSRGEGVIDPEEQRILGDVLEMRRLRVRDVMTPRVRMTALAADAGREDVIAAVKDSRLTQIPIYEGDIDHIIGILHVKRYLPNSDDIPVTDEQVLTDASFVPDVATLDRLLGHFRRAHSKSAIVVDEYGQTEGIVSVEDVVEELVGDIVGADEQPAAPARLIGLGKWRIGGDTSVYDWLEAFGIEIEPPKVATLGGLVVERLGHAPQPGDAVEIEGLRLEVETVARRAVVSVIVRMLGEEGPGHESGGAGGAGGPGGGE